MKRDIRLVTGAQMISSTQAQLYSVIMSSTTLEHNARCNTDRRAFASRWLTTRTPRVELPWWQNQQPKCVAFFDQTRLRERDEDRGLDQQIMAPGRARLKYAERFCRRHTLAPVQTGPRKWSKL